jgi:hypothetical protein
VRLKVKYAWRHQGRFQLSACFCDGPAINGLGNASNHCLAGGLISVCIGDEDGDGEAPSVGKGDEADIVGGGNHAELFTGSAGPMGDGRIAGQQPLIRCGPLVVSSIHVLSSVVCSGLSGEWSASRRSRATIAAGSA